MSINSLTPDYKIPSSEIISGGSYTVAFDSGQVKGWVSFYSYEPEWMIGMNNYFYSFSGGDIYRHNTNETRNEYYGIGYPSTIQTVLNEQPLDNKIFKTINLEGTDTWYLNITSDQQNTGVIDDEDFVKKEGSFFSYVRNIGQTPSGAAPNNGQSQEALRSINGIGTTVSYTVLPSGRIRYNFPATMNINGIIDVNDALYWGVLSGSSLGTTFYGGQIKAVVNNFTTTENYIEVELLTGSTPTQQDVYVYSIKNSIAESQGILGHYGVVNIYNNSTSKIELFAVQSEVMKSYP